MADRIDAILVKLGQPSGPAPLKRWLETLSARDGAKPPGDIATPETDVPVGTIELETDDLELHDTASGEIAAPSRRAAAGGESAVASVSALVTVPGPSPASYWPVSVAPSTHVAGNGSSGTGAATVVDNSFPGRRHRPSRAAAAAGAGGEAGGAGTQQHAGYPDAPGAALRDAGRCAGGHA